MIRFLMKFRCMFCGYTWEQALWPRRCPNCGKKDGIQEI